MKIFRQGDVLLIQVSAIPNGATDITPNGDIILSHGEVTGHAHRVIVADRPAAQRPKLWDAGAERYLQVVETVALSHEEHNAIVLDKGIYRQAFQFEEKREEISRVAD